MEGTATERRLAAILAADIVGYSRLIEKDEAATLAAIRKLRAETVDPLLARHKGRIVKLMGDGAIVEFGSVVDAVSCAVALQKECAEAQADVPADRRIVFRMGVNLGDVVVEGDDLLGDGVNVAARLEQLCDPGGVLLSGTAYDQLRGKLGLPLDFAGQQKVKNIAEPVRAYRVRLAGGRIPWRLRFRQHRRNVARAAAVFVVLALAGASTWLFFWPAEKVNAKPAIAVLPFDNYGGDEVTGRLANGITEDIITDLARFRTFDVIARNSTEVYRDRDVDIRQIAHELNVTYVLEGSIQREGDRIRATAQLIDAGSGAHVWSDRWDRPAQDIFSVQGEISEEIAGILGGNVGGGLISRNQVQRAKRLRATDLQAYDYFLLGLERKNNPAKESVPIGIEYLTKSIALDPNFASAYTTRAWLHLFSVSFNGVEAATAIASMTADTEKALQLDPQDAETISTLAYVRVLQGRYPEAEALLREALELSPADLHPVLTGAFCFPLLGFPDEGAELADRALRVLDPFIRPDGLGAAKDGYYLARRYEDTIATINRIPEDKRFRDSWVFLTASHARLGHEEEAAKARTKLLEAYPTVSAERMLNEDYVFARREDKEDFAEGFRIANLPICMKPDEIAEFESLKALPECEAERAKAVAKQF